MNEYQYASSDHCERSQFLKQKQGSLSLRWQWSLWVWNLLRFVLTLLRNDEGRISNRDIFFSIKVHNVSIHHIYGMLFHIWTGEGTPETPAPSEFAVVELVATVVCFDCWFVLGSTAASDSNECTSEIEALRSFVSMIYQRGMSKALLDSWAWKGTSETLLHLELAVVDVATTIVCFFRRLIIGSTAASNSTGSTSEIEALS